MNEKFEREYVKFTGERYKGSVKTYMKIMVSHTLKFLYYSRLAEYAKNSFARKYYSIRAKLAGGVPGMRYPDLKILVRV